MSPALKRLGIGVVFAAGLVYHLGIPAAAIVATNDDINVPVVEMPKDDNAKSADPEIDEEQQAEMEPLLSALKEIDARLDVGLTQSEHNRLVGDASVAARMVSYEELDPNVVTQGMKPLERALELYIRANTRWENCNWSYYSCTWRSIKWDVQSNWALASSKIDQAELYLTGSGSRSGSGETV